MDTERWFLELDGIAGDSTDTAHRGHIDVEAWSWGVTNGAPASVGSGAGAGRASFQDLRVTARLGSASPRLLLACATGRHLRTAMLTGVRPAGGAAREIARYELGDVTVTRVDHADDASGPPTEHVALNYATLRMSFFPQAASGASAPAVTAGYDVRANRPL